MKLKLPTFLAKITAFFIALLFGPPAFRARTCDISYQYRMPAGFPGDVNRMHPASIVAGLLDSTLPFLGYGQIAMFGDGTTGAVNSYRPLVPADGSATPIRAAGAIVRPYPTQQMSGGPTAAISEGAPPTSGVGDFLESGFILVKGRAGMNVRKGGLVHVRVAATSGPAIRGEFQAAADGTNTVTLANARYNGPADPSGNVEIQIWPTV